jgi:hypothetical protein
MDSNNKIYGRTSPIRKRSPSPLLPSCSNEKDIITLDPFTKENEKTTVFLVDEEFKNTTCYDREALLEWLVGTPTQPKEPLVEWVDMKDEVGHGGKPTDYAVFKLPDGYKYIDLPGIRALFYTETNVFYVEKVRSQVAIGNSQGTFGVSQLHGQMRVDVYTLEPEFTSLSPANQDVLQRANILYTQYETYSEQRAIKLNQMMANLVSLCDQYGVDIRMKTRIDNSRSPFDSYLTVTCRSNPHVWSNPHERVSAFMTGTWYLCVVAIIRIVTSFFRVTSEDNGMEEIQSPPGIYYEVQFNPKIDEPFGRIGPVLSTIHIPTVFFYSPAVNTMLFTLRELFEKYPHLVDTKNYHIKEEKPGVLQFDFVPTKLLDSLPKNRRKSK